MARYSRRTGPAAPFLITGGPVAVPGMSITRLFDDGELLISFSATIYNSNVVFVEMQHSLFIDNVEVTLGYHADMIHPLYYRSVSRTYLQPISEGRHTIDIRFSNGDGINHSIDPRDMDLVVIQLPLWESGADIVTL